MDKWKEVWDKDERVNKIILETLIKSDSFDSGSGSFGVDDWIEYINEFYTTIGIEKTDTNQFYDVFVRHSVFHYLKDLIYAKTVIFDINDKS